MSSQSPSNLFSIILAVIHADIRALMDFFITFLLCCITAAIIWVLEDRQRCTYFPPGPQRLPFLGNFFNVAIKSNIPALAFAKLGKIYGDIMYLKLGTLDAAIIWGNGEIWQTLRRFTIRTLRDFGFGRSASMDVVINEELAKFLEHFSEKLNRTRNNTMVITKELFDGSVLNVLWRLVTGKSFELGDERLDYLLQLSNDFLQASKNGADISLTFPFLRDWLPEWTGRNRQVMCIQKLCEFFRETLKEHRQNGTCASDPQSFVDIFLAKIDENQIASVFNGSQLSIPRIQDISNCNTLAFALLYMTLCPDKQEKVHEELNTVLPKDVVVTSSMKSKNFTLQLLVPFPPNREAVEDFKLREPERFLTKNGVFDRAMADLVVGFGGGRRVCLGQNLAEATLLMYFTTVMRKFKFERIASGNKKLAPTLVPVLGVVYSPRPFEVKEEEMLFKVLAQVKRHDWRRRQNTFADVLDGAVGPKNICELCGDL
ncbi:Farnesoate epoxidase, partial [Orchesella cincta]